MEEETSGEESACKRATPDECNSDILYSAKKTLYVCPADRISSVACLSAKGGARLVPLCVPQLVNHSVSGEQRTGAIAMDNVPISKNSSARKHNSYKFQEVFVDCCCSRRPGRSGQSAMPYWYMALQYSNQSMFHIPPAQFQVNCLLNWLPRTPLFEWLTSD